MSLQVAETLARADHAKNLHAYDFRILSIEQASLLSTVSAAKLCGHQTAGCVELCLALQLVSSKNLTTCPMQEGRSTKSFLVHSHHESNPTVNQTPCFALNIHFFQHTSPNRNQIPPPSYHHQALLISTPQTSIFLPTTPSFVEAPLNQNTTTQLF